MVRPGAIGEVLDVIRAAPRIYEGDDLARVSDLLDEVWHAADELPGEYDRIALGTAIVAAPKRGDEQLLRQAEQVRSAWETRLTHDPSDPVDQARIAARIDELVDGDRAVLDSQRGVGELRALLAMSDGAHGREQLGFASARDLDNALQTHVARPLATDGAIGAAGWELLGEWRFTRDPKLRAQWRSAIDDVALGRRALSPRASLSLVMSPASGWGERTRAQRMRLLDAFARSGDQPESIVRTRMHRRDSGIPRFSRILRSHVDRQVARAAAGTHDLPVGLTLRDLVESPTYEAAPREVRRRLVDAYAERSPHALFEEYEDLRDELDDVALAAGRRQADAAVAAARAPDQLPGWVTPGDILAADVTRDHAARLLPPPAADARHASTSEAAAMLLDARGRLEQLPGHTRTGAATRTLVEGTRRLVDDNVERLVGERADGYSTHPDYADLGRIRANLELLERLAPDVADAPRAAGSTAALDW